jgi:hypothetical protein
MGKKTILIIIMLAVLAIGCTQRYPLTMASIQNNKMFKGTINSDLTMSVTDNDGLLYNGLWTCVSDVPIVSLLSHYAYGAKIENLENLGKHKCKAVLVNNNKVVQVRHKPQWLSSRYCRQGCDGV